MVRDLNDPAFDQVLSLREAYRVMEVFVRDYLSHGDSPISDFLHVYVGETVRGLTTDPAAVEDFLDAYRSLSKGDATGR